METAWQLYLRRLLSVDLEFTYDDVLGWSAEEYDGLVAAGLISEIGPTKQVRCDACGEDHWEEVLWSEDGQTAFIPCKAGAPVRVDPARLRLWRADLTRFAALLAHSLALTGEVWPLPANRLWFLGRRRVAGTNPYFFFGAISPEDVLTATKEIRNAYGRVTGVLLVPFTPVDCAEEAKLRIIDVGLVISLMGKEITADIEFVEEQFLDGSRSLRPSIVKKPSRALIAHRRSILKAAMPTGELGGMRALARHLRVSETALHGMVRSDTTRYGDDTLTAVLERIGCTPTKWNRVPKSAARP